MPILQFSKLWDIHPYPDNPCDSVFENQCAIRMGVTLQSLGLTVWGVARCWFRHNPKHILRAQELADALLKKEEYVGRVTKYTKYTSLKVPVKWEQFAGRRGIVFIKDGWGPTDHIDLWNGSRLRGGDLSYFARGKEVWFWEL